MKFQDLILVVDNFRRDTDANGVSVGRFDLNAPFVLGQPAAQSFDWVKLNAMMEQVNRAGATRADALDLGLALADLLFPAAVLDALKTRLAQARQARQGVRLRLQICKELRRFPWEFVAVNQSSGEAGAQDFLVLDKSVSLVRQPASIRTVDELDPAGGDQLRVLAALASPTDKPRLDIDKEQASLQAVFSASPLFQAKLLMHATANDLMTGVEDYDLFHFAGHGALASTGMSVLPGKREAAGLLLLETPEHGSAAISAEVLAVALNGRGVRAAVFGACHSAASDDVSDWSGVSEAMIKAGLVAVVGMQFAVRDDSAIHFMSRFYTALAAGLTIDEAVQAGRLAMFVAAKDVRGFGTPVLYLRDSDGVIMPKLAEQVSGSSEHAKVTEQVRQSRETVNATRIDMRYSQGSIVNNSGSVTQHFGNTVNTQGGDYVTGEKKEINTGGGAYIGGNVNVKGDFVGRDKVVNNTYGASQSGDPRVGELLAVLEDVRRKLAATGVDGDLADTMESDMAFVVKLVQKPAPKLLIVKQRLNNVKQLLESDPAGADLARLVDDAVSRAERLFQ